MSGPTWEVRHGDCLDLMREMPSASVDAVVTDPPYGINTKSDGMGKLNPWADMTNAALWYREWLREARRVTGPRGFVWSCLNWRSLVTFQKASCDIGWPIESLMVWHKDWIGPGGAKGLRPSYEMVALWCGEDAALANRGLPDVQTFKWASQKPSGHPAEKPVSLMRWIIRQSNARSVLDPFAGSGTTGVAARLEGASFIGCEVDDAWHAYATARVASALDQGDLLTGAA